MHYHFEMVPFLLKRKNEGIEMSIENMDRLVLKNLICLYGERIYTNADIQFVDVERINGLTTSAAEIVTYCTVNHREILLAFVSSADFQQIADTIQQVVLQHPIPVIISTSEFNKDQLHTAQSMAWAYIVEPYSPAALLKLIQQRKYKSNINLIAGIENQDPGTQGTHHAIPPNALLWTSLNPKRYNDFVNAALDGYWIADFQGTILEVNDSYCAMTGYSKADLLGKRIAEVEAVESDKDVIARIQQIITNGADRFETQHRCADNSVIDFEVNINLLKSEEKLLCFFRDITERKKIEDIQMYLLQSSFVVDEKNYFRALARYIYQSLDFEYVCIDKLSGDLLSAETLAIMHNGIFEDNVSYTLSETPCGQVVEDTICCFPKNIQTLFPNDAVLQQIRAESYVGTILYSRTGAPIGLIAAISTKELKRPSLSATLLKLIAIRASGELERQLAEEELRESEAKHRNLLETMQEGIMETDLDQRILFVNNKLCAMLGYTREELVGQDSNILLTTEQDVLAMQRRMEDRLRGKSEQYTLDVKKADNSTVIMLINAAPVRNGNGEVYGSLATFLDITDSMRNEELLRANEYRYRSITENASDLIALVDLQGRYIFCNKAFYSLTGYQPEQIIGRSSFELAIPQEKDTLVQCFNELFTNASGEIRIVYRLICKNGAVRLIDKKSKLLKSEQQNQDLVLVVGKDVTDKIHSENILRARNAILEFAPHHTLYEILQKTLDEAELLTGSKIGFYHFLLEDQKTLSLQAWSTNTIQNMCKAEGHGLHYNVAEAGVWVDCIATGKPVIHNNYALLSHKKGMPDGHAPVIRELVVPVHRNNRIVAILGVGNKPFDYYEDDIKMVAQLADLAWEIAESKHAEEALLDSVEKYKLISRLSTDFAYSCIHNGKSYIINWISDAFYTITGYTEEELQRNQCWLFTAHPEDRDTIINKMLKLLPDEFAEDEFRLLDTQGNIHFISHQMECIADATAPGGTRIVGAAKDITKRKQTEAALKESEEKYRSLVQESPDAIAIYVNGKIVFTNKASLKLTGADSFDDLVGKSVMDFVAPESRELVKQRMVETFAKQRPLPAAEEKFLRLDGTTVDVEVIAFPIVFEKMNAVQIIARDISDRKKAQDEITVLSRAVEQSPASIVITDLNGNIEYVNPKVIEITGYNPAELIGQNPRILSSGELPKSVYTNLWETIASGAEWRGEFHNKKKNGELYWEYVSISPIKDQAGQISHYLAVKEDITERKEMEKVLIDARIQAESANKLKDAFIANISHEIRTPLNGILGLSGIIASIYEGSAGPEEKKYFTSLGISTKRLMSTIDMILNFSRLQVGEYPTNPAHLHLQKILDKLFNQYQPMASEKGLTLYRNYAASDDSIFADEASILSSIGNIVDNAIKFSHKGQVSLTTYKNAENELCVEIRDEGIGISDEYINRLFEPYTQELTGFGRGYEGVGLGLSIAKGFLALCNADISVISQKGLGSAFTITFHGSVPRLPEDIKTEPKEIAAPPQVTVKRGNANSTMRILLVEDDPINLMYMRSVLQKTFMVTTASTGNHALTLAGTESFDLILMDLSLKDGMDGLQITATIRNGGINAATPIIAVTGHAFPEDRTKAIQAGCTEYLAKPFSDQELFAIIEAVMGKLS